MNKFSNLPWPYDDDSGESDCGSPTGQPRPFLRWSAIRRVNDCFERLRKEYGL
jgi:hypothetical protein